MVQRFDMTANPPRLVVSKPGYEAGPNLADEFKTFDSNWFGGNGIKWVLRAQQSFQDQGINLPWKIYDMTISFPFALNYQPACVAFYCSAEPNDSGNGMVIQENYEVYASNSSVTVRAPFGAASPSGVSTLYVVVFESRPTQIRTEKTNRIIIGSNPYDGRKGFWVTEPGCRAGDLREPHIISSDNDYLKLHATGIVQPTEKGSAGTKYWIADFYFPALPYYPITFVQLAAKDSGNRVIYPFDVNDKSTDIPGYSISIYKDHIHLITRPRNASENFDFRVLVFRNKLRDG